MIQSRGSIFSEIYCPEWVNFGRSSTISTATFYKWRAKYGGLDVPMMSRLKELEAENARLKKMYAEERLKGDILKEILGKK